MKTFVYLCLFSLNAFSAMWAVIKVPKAVIYSDKQMSSAIGYFTKGSKLRVGSKLHSNGMLLATTYHGKIVFLKVSDTRTNRDEKLASSASDRIQESTLPKEKKHMFGFGFSSSSFSLSQGGDYLDESPTSSFGAFDFVYYKKFSGDHIDLKLATKFFELKEGNSRVSGLDLSMSYINYMLKLASFRVAGVLGFHLLPYLNRNFDNEFDSNGYGLGTSLGVEAHSQPFMNAHFVFGANYYYAYALGFSNPTKADDLDVSVDSSLILHGYNLYGHVVFKF